VRYEAPRPQYAPQPQYEAAPAPQYEASNSNYGAQRQYAQAAVRAAVQRSSYAGQRRAKKQAYDPAYHGDIEVSNSSLEPSVEYVEA
jgi:hypothetical protein